MRVYLCRHAQATHPVAGEADERRELTTEGVEQARALGAALASRDDPPALVLSSPLVRARQTAHEIGRATGAPVRIVEELAPGATVETLTLAVAGAQGPVATVGHQPDCSEIAVALLGHDPGFPVAGTAELDLPT